MGWSRAASSLSSDALLEPSRGKDGVAVAAVWDRAVTAPREPDASRNLLRLSGDVDIDHPFMCGVVLQQRISVRREQSMSFVTSPRKRSLNEYFQRTVALAVHHRALRLPRARRSGWAAKCSGGLAGLLVHPRQTNMRGLSSSSSSALMHAMFSGGHTSTPSSGGF